VYFLSHTFSQRSSFLTYRGIIKYLPPFVVKRVKLKSPLLQYWRLFIHHLAFSNSSDLFVAELLLYHISIHIERRFGSVKFAVGIFAIVQERRWSWSFTVICTDINTGVHCDGILLAFTLSPCRPQLHLFWSFSSHLQHPVSIRTHCSIVLPIPHLRGPI
jgi:hypothetical protein